MNALQTTSASALTFHDTPTDLKTNLNRLAVSDPITALTEIRKVHWQAIQHLGTSNKSLSQQEQQTLATCQAIEEALWKITRDPELLIPNAGGLDYLDEWTE